MASREKPTGHSNGKSSGAREDGRGPVSYTEIAPPSLDRLGLSQVWET